jgi:hypothetical protein
MFATLCGYEGLMQSHLIQVSEPWEFVGPKGQHSFSVKGLGLVKSPPQENWGNGFYLVEVDIPFEIDGELVRQLICSPRYEGDTLEMVVSSECTVGIARVRPNYNLAVDCVVNDKEVHYCAIGSIKTT